MSQDIYRQLQMRLDKYSLGFPETESGIELTILRKLFSEQDAELFLALTPMLEEPAAVAARINLDPEQTAAQLEDMAGRGLLFRLKRGDATKYSATAFVHGVFEFQVKSLDKELAELVEKYKKEKFSDSFIENADTFLRPIPVQRSVDVESNIATFDDAAAILKSVKQIVVAPCICRKQKGLLEDSCDKPSEVCFLFGSMGQYYLDNEMGRLVGPEEAIAILNTAHEAGLVTQPATAQNPAGMCNCCGDCCGPLSALNLHPRPAEIVFSNYFASVDTDACNGCGICLDRCQMDALELVDDDTRVEVKSHRCIGCGLCVTTCPTEAMTLSPKDEDKMRTPPKSSMEQMLIMAQKRGVKF